jgi:DNA repair protein RecO (recombination protein O)
MRSKEAPVSNGNVFRTKAILLRRTNYGEADRILQLLTPDKGKISAIAKGVRRGKSKLAGGLELFSICDVTIREGRGDMGLVTSARLETFYGNILHDYERLQLGYECIKEVGRASETVAEPEFFELLNISLASLHDLQVPRELVEIWFRLQLAVLLGVALNLATTRGNKPLQPDKKYNFDFDEMHFVEHASGRFSQDHIKLLRLLSAKNPRVVARVAGIENLFEDSLWLARAVDPLK